LFQINVPAPPLAYCSARADALGQIDVGWIHACGASSRDQSSGRRGPARPDAL